MNPTILRQLLLPVDGVEVDVIFLHDIAGEVETELLVCHGVHRQAFLAPARSSEPNGCPRWHSRSCTLPLWYTSPTMKNATDRRAAARKAAATRKHRAAGKKAAAKKKANIAVRKRSEAAKKANETRKRNVAAKKRSDAARKANETRQRNTAAEKTVETQKETLPSDVPPITPLT